MVPETCDPTCTVVTALIVPVASTTSWMSPRSALAVKYCGWSLPLNWKAAKMPTAITTSNAMIQWRFINVTEPPDSILMESYNLLMYFGGGRCGFCQSLHRFTLYKDSRLHFSEFSLNFQLLEVK